MVSETSRGMGVTSLSLGFMLMSKCFLTFGDRFTYCWKSFAGLLRTVEWPEGSTAFPLAIFHGEGGGGGGRPCYRRSTR